MGLDKLRPVEAPPLALARSECGIPTGTSRNLPLVSARLPVLLVLPLALELPVLPLLPVLLVLPLLPLPLVLPLLPVLLVLLPLALLLLALLLLAFSTAELLVPVPDTSLRNRWANPGPAPAPAPAMPSSRRFVGTVVGG